MTDFVSAGKKAIEHFRQELSRMRTGRASASLLESVKVDYYGSLVPLQQLGNITVPEPRMIHIQVYDGSAVEAVEKAILQADLGLNPSRDGNAVRVVIPALTEERRKEILKKFSKMAEEAKVGVRNHRRDANEALKKQKDDKEISEDDLRRKTEEIQKQTDGFIKEIDEILKSKEKDVLTV